MTRTTAPAADGVHALPPPEQWTPSARKRRAVYALTPGAPFLRTEFWLMQTTLAIWQREQGMPADVPHAELFGLELAGDWGLGQLGWCEAAFCPGFEIRIAEDRGATEVEQDAAGRQVLYFKGRREGFMPEYIGHPVRDMRSWQEQVKWRLDPATPARYADLPARKAAARKAAARGLMIVQDLIGGYMYLRSLIGPEELLFAFYDQPELIEDCMATWLALADAVIARHQEFVTIDEVFLAEDICYNHGALISPDMMRRFLFPYYQQLLTNLRRRQIDRSRHLYVQVDTDGDCRPVIDLYRHAIGMDVMSPFEVASGCDVVELGRQCPDLVMRGGLDKRVLTQGRAAIDAYLEHVLPAMRQRGGYIPCLDHGVPNEVRYDDYRHFRQRCVELGG